MLDFTLTRQINAPPSRVYTIFADVTVLQKAVPEIIEVEILSETKIGHGVRYRETRKMFGRVAQEVMEMTEAVEDQRLRLASSPQGLTWETLVEVNPTQAGTALRYTCHITPTGMMGRMMLLFMKSTITKALERDLDAIKAFAEMDEPF